MAKLKTLKMSFTHVALPVEIEVRVTYVERNQDSVTSARNYARSLLVDSSQWVGVASKVEDYQ